MSDYIIKLTNNTTLTTIPEGEIDDTSCSITLFGKNSVGYGLELDRNLVQILENFAGMGPPDQPLQGQLWWDSINSVLRVRRDQTWAPVGINSTLLQPDSGDSQVGDLWWDSAKQQLFAFNGSAWMIVGPSFTSSQGTSGTIADTILDDQGTEHTIVKLFSNNLLLAIISSDPMFIPASLAGYASIKPGINLPTANGGYYGDSENALKLGGIDAANYLRSDVPSITNFSLGVKTNTGLNVGLNNDLTLKIENNAVKFNSNTEGRDVEFYVTTPIGEKLGLRINGATGEVTIGDSSTSATSVATIGYVDASIATAEDKYLFKDGSVRLSGDLLPNSASSISLGSDVFKYNAIYANTLFTSSLNAETGGFTSVQINNAPTTSASATNKQYVDGLTSALSSQMTSLNQTTIDTIVGPTAPANMSTISELASALNNNPIYATSMAATVALLAPKASPALTGVPTAPTPSANSNDTQIATTAYVSGLVNTAATSITDVLMTGYAPIDSPIFSGLPTAPTPSPGDTTSRIATTNFVTNAITNLTSNDATFNNITVSGSINAASDGFVNIGSSGNKFNIVYANTFSGIATTATYADLAEKYVADDEYAPGTVLDFGGDKEVTLSVGKELTRVAGVVSTAPAYLMNDQCKGEHVVSVALQGRVPVRVIGFIQKGDLLVSAGNGCAKRHLSPPVGSVIGKALEVHAGEESLIEVAIGRC